MATKKLISIPAGFKERSALTSAMIQRVTYSNQAVIFTSSENPSENDFDISKLIGVFIQSEAQTVDVLLPAFEITGGYFFDAKSATTKQVFGSAKDRLLGFEMTEGGTDFIHPAWTLLWPDPTWSNLDESNFVSGWTFIVTPPSPQSKFPPSHQPLSMYSLSECPQIKSSEIEFDSLSDQEMKVRIQLVVDGPAPDKFLWDWGDGTNTEATSNPLGLHIYQRSDQSEKHLVVKVKSIGPDNCEEELFIPVDILQKKITKQCLGLHLLFSFFLSLFAGSALQQIAIWAFGTTDFHFLISPLLLMILSGIAAALVLWLWIQKSQEFHCRPSDCHKYLSLMAAGLTGTSVAFDLGRTVSEKTGWAAVVMFIFAAFYGYKWYRDCAAKSSASLFFMHFGVFVLVALLFILGL